MNEFGRYIERYHLKNDLYKRNLKNDKKIFENTK